MASIIRSTMERPYSAPLNFRDLFCPAFRPFGGLVIIDEIQRMAQLFYTLRLLADRINLSIRSLVLGSASRGLVRGVSESLFWSTHIGAELDLLLLETALDVALNSSVAIMRHP